MTSYIIKCIPPKFDIWLPWLLSYCFDTCTQIFRDPQDVRFPKNVW